MISAKFFWGNVLLGGSNKYIDAKNSNFEFFESALYIWNQWVTGFDSLFRMNMTSCETHTKSIFLTLLEIDYRLIAY